MSVADVRRIKKLAQRLNARDSDIIRFAVKGMLARLGPLYEPEVRGRALVPVLIEAGVDFLRFFDLDAARLDSLINGDAEPDKRVAREDLALLALTGGQEPYAALMLSELVQADERQLRSKDLSGSLREYLYEKYVYRANGDTDIPEPPRFALASGGQP